MWKTSGKIKSVQRIALTFSYTTDIDYVTLKTKSTVVR
jgi:hypothetical protein